MILIRKQRMCVEKKEKKMCVARALKKANFKEKPGFDKKIFVDTYIVIRYISVWLAPKSWSEYTTTQHTRAGRNIQPTLKSEKLIK